MKAYVKQVREDGKIDLLLQKPGQAKVEDFPATLLDYIREQGGRIALNDKSPAEEIYATFGVQQENLQKGCGRFVQKEPGCLGGEMESGLGISSQSLGISLLVNRDNH